MTIYRKKKSRVNYRKIYEDYHGDIPKDCNGRTYEVHHIDGNHANNNPNNLIAVTIEDHYRIHYNQGDWAACLLIAERLKIDPEKKSELAQKVQLQRIYDGTHHFLNEEFKENTKQRNKKMIEAGEHPFQQDNIRKLSKLVASETQKRKLENGSHPFLQEDIRKKAKEKAVTKQNLFLSKGEHIFQDKKKRAEWLEKQMNESNHPTQNPELQRQKAVKRIESGTHPWVQKNYQHDLNLKMLAEGKHPSQKKKECPFCKKVVDAANYSRWHGENCTKR